MKPPVASKLAVGHIVGHVSDSHFSGYRWFQVLIISNVYKHAINAAFYIYAQSGEDAAKRGDRRQCIK